MTAHTYTAAEIHEHRDALLGIEVLLNQLFNGSIYEMEPVETEIVVQALASDSKARLNKALAWLEEMCDRAEAAENAA